MSKIRGAKDMKDLGNSAISLWDSYGNSGCPYLDVSSIPWVHT